MADKRDLLYLSDFIAPDTGAVIDLARRLRGMPRGSHVDLLRGRAIALWLEGSGAGDAAALETTRLSYEIGVAQLGGHLVVLDDPSRLGGSVAAAARWLSRNVDLVVCATRDPARLAALAEAATVSVVNAGSADAHPVQVLADVSTIVESFLRDLEDGSIADRRFAFLGDCASNVGRSWLDAAPFFGFQLALSAPPGFWPPPDEIRAATGYVSLHANPADALEGAEVVCVHALPRAGDDLAEARARFVLNAATLGGVAPHAIVLHPLPTDHGPEIDDETLAGPRSRAWDQAENRLHVQKALLCYLLGVGLADEDDPV